VSANTFVPLPCWAPCRTRSWWVPLGRGCSLFGFGPLELLGVGLESPPALRSPRGPRRMGCWSFSSWQAFSSKIRLQGRNKGWEQVPSWRSAHFLSQEMVEATRRVPSRTSSQGSRSPAAPRCQVTGGKAGGGTEGFSQQAPSLARCLSPDAPPRCSEPRRQTQSS